MQDSHSPQPTSRSASLDAQGNPMLGQQPFSPIFAVSARTPLVLLGAFSMAAMGCAFSSPGRENDGAVSTMVPEGASQRPSQAPSTVEFNDAASTTQQPPLSADASAGLVDALAASYAADMAALAEMQRLQREAAGAVTTQTPGNRGIPAVQAMPLAPRPTATGDQAYASNPPAEQTPKSLVRTPAVTPTKKPIPPAPPTEPSAEPTPEPASQEQPGHETPGHETPGHETPGHETPGHETPGHETPGEPQAQGQATETTPASTESTTEPAAKSEAAPKVAPRADAQGNTQGNTQANTRGDSNAAAAATAAPGTIPASPEVLRANAGLELPPAPAAAPTEPAELALLLAESLAKQGEESSEPMREWLAFAAIAVANPDLKLPEDFGADLLPSERERVVKAHAAFTALGTSLRAGDCDIDRSLTESLIAALTGGPKLSIPKVDLCSRVDGFGRYTPLTNHKFLARANTRFIVYTELEGFNSDYTDGGFVTRLATRVTIESERDNIEVWQRSPEWTAVVDTSDVRRGEFFLCEIIPISEYLSVGSYRLKIEVRDEATGTVAVSMVPIHVVADPAMAAVQD